MKTNIYIKPAWLLAAGIFSVIAGRAQSVEQHVVANGGGSSTAIAGYTIDYTIGEMAIQTIGISSIFTQGFEQPTAPLPLPVTFLNIRAVNKNGYGVVSFSTAQEINNDHFIIEHSNDNRTFDTAGTVKSKAFNGNSSTPLQYSFTDATVLDAQNFYRVVQVDKNGNATYSNIVPLALANGSVLTLNAYPNPASTQLTVTLSEARPNATITVYNATGVKMTTINVNQLTQTVLNLSGWAPGTYVLSYYTGTQSLQYTFIKD